MLALKVVKKVAKLVSIWILNAIKFTSFLLWHSIYLFFDQKKFSDFMTKIIVLCFMFCTNKLSIFFGIENNFHNVIG